MLGKNDLLVWNITSAQRPKLDQSNVAKLLILFIFFYRINNSDIKV